MAVSVNGVCWFPEKHPFQLDFIRGSWGPHEVLYMETRSIVRLDMPGVPEDGFKYTKEGDNNRITFKGKAPPMKGKPPFPDEPERVYEGYLQLPCNPNHLSIFVKPENGSFFFAFVDTDVKPVVFTLRLPKSVPPLPGSTSEQQQHHPYLFENPPRKAWIRTFLEKYMFEMDQIKSPKDAAPAAVETSGTSRKRIMHKVPETATGSIMKYHHPTCPCRWCKDVWYLETCTTTRDVICYMNQLLTQGPIGVWEKRAVSEDGLSYSLYVRADLPGLLPSLCTVEVQNCRIVVFGKLANDQSRLTAPRDYFFVELQCSCCKFDRDIHKDHEYGILRLFCKIIPAKSYLRPCCQVARSLSTINN